MDKRRSKKRIVLWAISVPAAAILLVLLALYLAGSGARSRGDDALSIVESYDSTGFSGLSVAADGTATVRLEKNDLYWFGTKYGLFDRLLEKSGTMEGLEDASFGFRLDSGGVIVTIERKLLGFIPVIFKVKASTASMGTVTTLTPREVVLDDGLTLPESWWPEYLRRSYTVDFADCDISDAISAVRFSGNALILDVDGLSGIWRGEMTADEDMLAALRLYGVGKQDTYGLMQWYSEENGSVSMDEALERICASGDAENAMAELLALCSEETCESLSEGCTPFLRDYLVRPILQLRSARREELNAYFAGERARYEKLLTSVREMYRAGRLTINLTGWLRTDTGAPLELGELSSLSASNVDARLVLLTADVGYGSEICTHDMPELKQIPVYRPSNVKHLDTGHVYDLGVVMTTEGGETVLLHFRQDETFTMTPLDMDTYVALLVAEKNPVVDMGTILEKDL